MKTRVQKWGNSLAIRIPKVLADDAGLREDAPVELELDLGELRIRALEKPLYTLDELLAHTDGPDPHGETDWGPPVGKEVW